MKTLLEFTHANLELFLRIIAAAQVGLAVVSFFLPRILDWKADIARMTLLVREVFVIHSWFISLTLMIWGVLTWRFAPEMAHAPSDLSHWLCAAIGTFWGFRCVLQWLHYSPAHWRGIPSRTLIHWLCFLGYGFWAAIYAVAAVS